MSTTVNAQLRLIDEIIVAVRAETGWHLHAFECLPNELPQYLARTELAHLPHCIVDHRRVTTENFGKYLARPARRAGWQRWKEDIWFPMDEPMPVLPGTPKPGTFSLRLRGVFFGTIVIIVEIDGQRFRCCLDKAEDSLILFTRFVRLLTTGRYPHGVLFDSGSTDVIIQQEPRSGLCRFWANPWHDGKPAVIDIIVDQAHLIQQFVALAAAMADHPCFGREFVLFTMSDDEEYEHLSEIAEANFVEALAQGRVVVPDVADDMATEDAEADFIVHWIIEGRPLTVGETVLVDQRRSMLKTLTVPADLP